MFDSIKSSINECYESVKAVVSEKLGITEPETDETVPEFGEVSIFSDENDAVTDDNSDSFEKVNTPINLEEIYTPESSYSQTQENTIQSNKLINTNTSPVQTNQRINLLTNSMISDLEFEQRRIQAQKSSGGIVDSISSLFSIGIFSDESNLSDKQEVLQKAVNSGQMNDFKEAYKTIYADKEVIVDKNGTVVNKDDLIQSDANQCTTIKVADYLIKI